ncbi:hypothetical protein OROMI_032620 [Orobanche minor]
MEIIYNEMEHEDVYENDVDEVDDGNADSRKGSLEMVLADVAVEPLDVVDPSQNDDAASGDDQDLNFIGGDDDDDDDMTE